MLTTVSKYDTVGVRNQEESMKYIFRAWYKDEPYKFTQKAINDELFFVMENDYECRYPFLIPFIDSDWTVERFTGIHDSTTWEELTNQERSDWLWEGNTLNEWKGKMIFEGDIVKCHALETDEIVTVKDRKIPIEFNWVDIYNGVTIKIIRNIHENRELLENIE